MDLTKNIDVSSSTPKEKKAKKEKKEKKAKKEVKSESNDTTESPETVNIPENQENSEKKSEKEKKRKEKKEKKIDKAKAKTINEGRGENESEPSNLDVPERSTATGDIPEENTSSKPKTDPKNTQGNKTNGNKPASSQVPKSPGIWIGNLNYETSREALIRFFSKVGTPTRVNLAFQRKGKNKGFAYIDFETEELANKACELSEYRLDDRVVLIKRSDDFNKDVAAQPVIKKRRTPNSKNPTVYLKNLSFHTSRKSLIDLALTFGNIVNVRCPTFPDNPRRLQGYAYIDFKSQSSADKAIEALNGYSLDGREIEAEYSSQNAYEQRSSIKRLKKAAPAHKASV